MTTHTPLPHAARRRCRSCVRSMAACAVVVCAAAGGCGYTGIETYYGRGQPPLATASVNGTDVLTGMFAQSGRSVARRRALITSDMQSVDTIVWVPDDWAAPSVEVCGWFDRWLSAGRGRTLVYVGRSFDASPVYWRQATELAPASQQEAYRQEAVTATLGARPFRALGASELVCEWFSLQAEANRPADKLTGPWSDGVDATRAAIERTWRLEPRPPATPLLAAEGEPLVARLEQPGWNGGRVLLVANGSFVLNMPLVNHEHRRLAARLIEATPQGRVVFLESGRGGPPIDPPANDDSLWRIAGAWPLNAILLHFAVLGVIFCFARWPIFGRPRTPPVDVIADFGKHVAAVGELLARTGDRQYAAARLLSADELTSGGARAIGPRNRGRHPR